MNKKTKSFLLSTLFFCTAALGAGDAAASAPHQVRLENGTKLDAWTPATVEGGWLTFVMADGTHAVVRTDPQARMNVPAGGRWEDAVLLLASGGAVELRGDVRVNDNSLIFKRKDGLALTLPLSKVARATAVDRPAPVKTAGAERPAQPTGAVVAITNEDLPEVHDPSPEVGEEAEGDAEGEAAPARVEDEDWWRSEMSRLNLKLEAAQKKVYAVFTEKRALEQEVASTGFETTDQKKRRAELDKLIEKAERERAKVRGERKRLQAEAQAKEIPHEWLRGS